MRFLIAALTLISSTAFASCPNLAGTYSTCRSTTGSTSGSTNLIVKQYVKDGVTVYETEETDNESHQVENAVLVTNGRIIETSQPAGDVTVDFAQVSECTNGAVYTALQIKTQGQTIAVVQGLFSKSGNTLFQKIKSTTIHGEVEDTLICE